MSLMLWMVRVYIIRVNVSLWRNEIELAYRRIEEGEDADINTLDNPPFSILSGSTMSTPSH